MIRSLAPDEKGDVATQEPLLDSGEQGCIGGGVGSRLPSPMRKAGLRTLLLLVAATPTTTKRTVLPQAQLAHAARVHGCDSACHASTAAGGPRSRHGPYQAANACLSPGRAGQRGPATRRVRHR